MRTAVLILIVLVLGCSSGDAAVEADPDNAASDVTTPVPSACVEADAGPVTDSAIRLATDRVEAGATLGFDWDVDKLQPDSVVGDEVIIQCWTGSTWLAQWLVAGVFDPAPTLDAWEEGTPMTVTADGWEPGPGSIPLPADAAPATYRVVASEVIDGRTQPHHASFVVVAGP